MVVQVMSLSRRTLIPVDMRYLRLNRETDRERATLPLDALDGHSPPVLRDDIHDYGQTDAQPPNPGARSILRTVKALE